MAEAFLKKLFEESEVVTECPVCHDPYGTLNSKGKTEREIRLPCGHLIGSACAHKWFMLNNTVSHLLRVVIPPFILFDPKIILQEQC